MPADGPVIGKFAFVCSLDSGNGAVFQSGNRGQLFGATFGPAADIKMVTNQQEERFTPNKVAGAEHGVSVPAWRGLFNELQAAAFSTGRDFIGDLIAGTNHYTNFLDPG